MIHRAKHARRAVAGLSAVALSSTALMLGSSPAVAADPWDVVDLTGRVVTPAGVGLEKVFVAAYTTPSNGSYPRFVSWTETDADGNYAFSSLDPESLEFFNPSVPEIKNETEFKLFFSWQPATPADYHSVGYLDRGLGGSKTIGAAESVAIAAGAATTAPTQALPVAAGVIVELTTPTGAPVTGGRADLLHADASDPFESWNRSADVWSDDGFYPSSAPEDGLVYIRGVEPESYFVRGDGWTEDAATGDFINYVDRFYGGDGSFAKASKISVKAGEFTRISIQLSKDLMVLSKPRIIGNTSFGSTLKADPGMWLGGYYEAALRSPNYDFKYQWLRGDTVVGTGETYKLTRADKGKKIRLVITAYGGNFTGTAISAASPKVGEKSKVKVTKVKGKKVTVVVKAKKKRLGSGKGKVVLVTADGTVASKKVKLKGGVATLTVRNKFLGEKLFVLYLGGGKLGSDTVAVKSGKKK